MGFLMFMSGDTLALSAVPPFALHNVYTIYLWWKFKGQNDHTPGNLVKHFGWIIGYNVMFAFFFDIFLLIIDEIPFTSVSIPDRALYVALVAQFVGYVWMSSIKSGLENWEDERA